MLAPRVFATNLTAYVQSCTETSWVQCAASLYWLLRMQCQPGDLQLPLSSVQKISVLPSHLDTQQSTQLLTDSLCQLKLLCLLAMQAVP